MSAGRPTAHSPELVEAICADLAEGKRLTDVLRGEGMPAVRTWFDWMKRHPETREAYTIALEIRAEMDADRIEDIAAKAAVKPTKEGVSAARLQVDTIYRLMQARKPRLYAPIQRNTGADGKSDPTLTHRVELTAEQRRAAQLALLQKMRLEEAHG